MSVSNILVADINNAGDLSEFLNLTLSEAKLPQEIKPIYAIDNLPDLLGWRQFKLLCDAMDIEIPTAFASKILAGSYFASVIEKRALSHRAQRDHREQSQVYEGML